MGPENRISINTLTYVDARTGDRNVMAPPVSRRDSSRKTISNNKPVAILMAVNFAIAAGFGALAVKSCQEDSGQSIQVNSSQGR